MRYVLFRKSFGYANAPNISHVTRPDGTATMCGRRGWETDEGAYDPNLGVDCLRCAKAVAKAELMKTTGAKPMQTTDTRTLAQLAQEALAVQDACNLCGVAQSFARAMLRLGEFTNGTDERNHHPIAVLWASKISSLAGNGSGDLLPYMRADEAVRLMANQLT